MEEETVFTAQETHYPYGELTGIKNTQYVF